MSDKCYSIDGENYNLTGVGEMFDQLKCDGEFAVGRSYHEADAVPISHRQLINKFTIGGLLETLDDRGGDLVGEVFDNDYSNASNDAEKELYDLLVGWAEKHVDISRYYLVKNSVEKFVTDLDIQENPS